MKEFEAIRDKIQQYKNEGKKVFTTSSFQSHSIILLHILSRIDRSIPVFFLNTGYHFPETINFKEVITRLFGLNTVDLSSATPKYMQKDGHGQLLFTSDPDHCCYLNKVQPLESILMSYDVWINGVRADQSNIRKNFGLEEKAPHGTLRYHPVIHWTSEQIDEYRKIYNLPVNPLEIKGYLSVGCEPCTRKLDPEMAERESRWYGLSKTECGLNTDLVIK
jgi:phosphoadenosine phosphosulfate reductase